MDTEIQKLIADWQFRKTEEIEAKVRAELTRGSVYQGFSNYETYWVATHLKTRENYVTMSEYLTDGDYTEWLTANARNELVKLLSDDNVSNGVKLIYDALVLYILERVDWGEVARYIAD